MRNKLFKRIRQLYKISNYININKLIDLSFTLNYIIIDNYKRSIGILARFIKADKAQALYLFRRLDTGLAKDNRFKPIYYLIIPQTAFYNPLT